MSGKDSACAADRFKRALPFSFGERIHVFRRKMKCAVDLAEERRKSSNVKAYVHAWYRHGGSAGSNERPNSNKLAHRLRRLLKRSFKKRF